MPVPAHFVTVTCDQTKPMATIGSITFTGAGFSLFFITSSLGGPEVTLPHTLVLTEILTVNYTIPGSAGTGTMNINSDDTSSPFLINIDVTS
jgi:hypothetical protein